MAIHVPVRRCGGVDFLVHFFNAKEESVKVSNLFAVNYLVEITEHI